MNHPFPAVPLLLALLAVCFPNRYIRPYMPSGSSFMRNPPPPLEACYPLGIPDEVLAEVIKNATLSNDRLPKYYFAGCPFLCRAWS